MLSAGRVGRPHGLDGHFLVSDAREELLELGRTVTVADREASIVSRKGDARRVILRLDLTPDRTAAEELRGRDLMVDRSAAPPLEDDEFWAEDLEGCTVADGDRTLGTVVRLLGLPSCEALELEDGTLVPMVRDAIRSIDVKAKRIEINAGFLGAA